MNVTVASVHQQRSQLGKVVVFTIVVAVAVVVAFDVAVCSDNDMEMKTSV